MTIQTKFGFAAGIFTAFLLTTAPAFAGLLNTAENFSVLGGSTVTNTGMTTVSGNVGVSAGSAVTGLAPTDVTGTVHSADAAAAAAQADAATAFTALAGQVPTVDLSGQDLGGRTLTPGVYRFSNAALLTGPLTLDAQGSSDATWTFQIGSTLTTASNSVIQVNNGGSPGRVFWQVGSSATLGTGTAFVGNIIADQSITLTTGARVNGRALALKGAVTLDSNTIHIPIITAEQPPSSEPLTAIEPIKTTPAVQPPAVEAAVAETAVVPPPAAEAAVTVPDVVEPIAAEPIVVEAAADEPPVVGKQTITPLAAFRVASLPSDTGLELAPPMSPTGDV